MSAKRSMPRHAEGARRKHKRTGLFASTEVRGGGAKNNLLGLPQDIA